MKPISFFTILKSEHYKLRFNIAIWLFLLFPLFMTLCVDIYVLHKHADAVNNPTITFDYNPWVWVLGRYIFDSYALLYPILAAHSFTRNIDSRSFSNCFSSVVSSRSCTSIPYFFAKTFNASG